MLERISQSKILRPEQSLMDFQSSTNRRFGFRKSVELPTDDTQTGERGRQVMLVNGG